MVKFGLKVIILCIFLASIVESVTNQTNQEEVTDSQLRNSATNLEKNDIIIDRSHRQLTYARPDSSYNVVLKNFAIELSSTIPFAGWAISFLIITFWPEEEVNLFEQIESFVDDKIRYNNLQIAIDNFEDALEYLHNDLANYQESLNELKSNETLATNLVACVSRAQDLRISLDIDTEVVTIDEEKRDQHYHLMPFEVAFALLHLTVLRERCLYGNTYKEDNSTDDTDEWCNIGDPWDLGLLSYHNMYSEYFQFMNENWRQWRKSQMKITYKKKSLGRGYYAFRATLTDWAGQHETSRFTANKSWGHLFTMDKDKKKSRNQARGQAEARRNEWLDEEKVVWDELMEPVLSDLYGEFCSTLDGWHCSRECEIINPNLGTPFEESHHDLGSDVNAMLSQSVDTCGLGYYCKERLCERQGDYGASCNDYNQCIEYPPGLFCSAGVRKCAEIREEQRICKSDNHCPHSDYSKCGGESIGKCRKPVGASCSKNYHCAAAGCDTSSKKCAPTLGNIWNANRHGDNKAYCLDAPSSNDRIFIYDCDRGNNNQRFDYYESKQLVLRRDPTFCISNNGPTKGSMISLSPCEYNDKKQKWTLEESTGLIRAKNSNGSDSNQCIMVRNKNMEQREELYLWPCNQNTITQKWGVLDHFFLLKNDHNSNYCLDGAEENSQFHLWECRSNNENQKFIFDEYSRLVSIQNWYRYCIEYEDNNFGKLRLKKCNNQANQRWKYENGKLKTFASNLCVTVTVSEMGKGAHVYLATCRQPSSYAVSFQWNTQIVS